MCGSELNPKWKSTTEENRKFYKLVSEKCQSLNPYAALVQCAHETKTADGYWTSELFLKANNAAGIKNSKTWGGKIYRKLTWEQDKKGNKKDVYADFKAYNNIEEFLYDYELKIISTYPQCLDHVDSFWSVLQGLQAGKYKWATDHNYFKKLARTAIELAPDIFGHNAWSDKINDSWQYARKRGYMTYENVKTVEDILDGVCGSECINTGKPCSICLDFGHGGKDSGACAQGIKEKDLNAALGVKVSKYLLLNGCDICQTRAGDVFRSLDERCEHANKNNCDFFISLHHNAATDAKANGFEVFAPAGYIDGRVRESMDLACAIIDAVKAALPDTKIRGMKTADLAVLRGTQMPAILIEAGFMTNPFDLQNITDSGYQHVMARAIGSAVISFVNGGKHAG